MTESDDLLLSYEARCAKALAAASSAIYFKDGKPKTALLKVVEALSPDMLEMLNTGNPNTFQVISKLDSYQSMWFLTGVTEDSTPKPYQPRWLNFSTMNRDEVMAFNLGCSSVESAIVDKLGIEVLPNDKSKVWDSVCTRIDIVVQEHAEMLSALKQVGEIIKGMPSSPTSDPYVDKGRAVVFPTLRKILRDEPIDSKGKDVPHQTKVKWMQEWCDVHGVDLELNSSCGFGRPCVGVAKHNTFLDYKWTDTDTITVGQDVWTPKDAYFKHPCVAVLGTGEEAESQLYDWLLWFSTNGYVPCIVANPKFDPNDDTSVLFA